ncbi:hypothetical protein MRB53_029011 [Persea americana]|uniref:Uncharacterized protein n=1 Tax=Persea americana TaxID=3435 RepID=A0ACC2KHI4_PERAE|nr:hypothetical protein MRB53_029011 [Persea americana]
MALKATESSSKPKKSKEQSNEASGTITSRIWQLKNQIQAARVVSIKDKVEKNRKNLEVHTSQILTSATSKKDLCSMETNTMKNMLSFRIESTLHRSSDPEPADKESVPCQEVLPAAIVFGNDNDGESLIHFIKLPYIEKIQRYTTWIFLSRNQRMAEDQSVVGRRRIYYDQYGSEALICSDSEEEFPEPVEEKREFSEGEDQILWKAIQEFGPNQEVLNILCQFIEASSNEILERYETLMVKYEDKHVNDSEGSGPPEELGSKKITFSDKKLSVALDSFDNLFCRRCLIFDCRLHGCSQNLVIPSERQSFGCDFEENGIPCSDQCYLQGRKSAQNVHCDRSDSSTKCQKDDATPACLKKTDTLSPESADILIPEVATEVLHTETPLEVPCPENVGKGKDLKRGNMPLGEFEPGGDVFSVSAVKKQKRGTTSDIVFVPESPTDGDSISTADRKYSGSSTPNDSQLANNSEDVPHESSECHLRKNIFPGGVAFGNSDNMIEAEENNENEVLAQRQLSNSSEGQDEIAVSGCVWNPIEKELYLKGIEIFGKNSCLIARNLLSGLKTCKEVANYMFNDGAAIPHRSAIPNSGSEDNERADPDETEQEMPKRTRFWRRRGRARKLKYSWKSAGHPSIRKRIADGKHQSCKQYTPCGCQLMCGKQCPCLHNGTCCEKYCGCSKSCKNRFRGCHCAKSQCRSRQCPCFAAGRECDPDVCRNCWVSCGDGSLGEPPLRGDGYQCGNMKLFLKQQQRILLGKSDVAGWGAFIKNPVNKNDYLGEYTGELISHKEADKRGKIYDRTNSSFLFDLNDQYVLDAYRKGDKLKFANHSSNPNCYAKVMLVAGDHRVGIFAKEHIEASEELFYDYRYGPDQAPAWARKPDGSRRDDSSVSYGRAQKIA